MQRQQQRIPKLAHSLPLTAADWVASRIVANLALGLSVILLGMLFALPLSPSAERTGLLRHAGIFALSWCTFSITWFAWRPNRSSIGMGVCVPVLCLGLGLFGLWHPSIAVPVLAVLLATGMWVLRSQLHPMLTVGDSAGSRLSFFGFASLLGKWPLHLIGLINQAGIVFMGICAGAMSAPLGSGQFHIFALVFPPFLARKINAQRVAVHGLPVSAPKLAASILLPSLFSICLGVLVGLSISPQKYFARNDIGLLTEYYLAPNESPRLQVPSSLHYWTLSKEPVAIEAPWGEVSHIQPQRVFAFIPLFRVHPYDLGPSSSPRFIAWQLSRVFSEVHGMSLSPQEIEDQYLIDSPYIQSLTYEVESQGVALNSARLPNRFWSLVLFSMLGWYWLFYLSLRWFRTPTATPKAQQIHIFWVVLSCIFTLMICVTFGSDSGRTTVNIAESFTGTLEYYTQGRHWRLGLPLFFLGTLLAYLHLTHLMHTTEPMSGSNAFTYGTKRMRLLFRPSEEQR